MYEFEERYICPILKNKSSSYLRFIDNIFMVWIKSENELKSFINEIKRSFIKFDFKFSKEKFEFLDTLVYKDHNNRLQKIISKKQADHQNYLDAKSAHTLSLKKEYSLQTSIKNKTCLLNFWWIQKAFKWLG